MRDPVREFFEEKLQMIFSSSHTNQILRQTGDGKRMTLETIESIQTLVERKELRVKKFDFDSKVHCDDIGEQAKEIKNLIDQHERIDSKILDHYKKECSQQEDQFQRKLKERKDRSVERSMSRSMDIGGSRRQINKKAFGEDKAPPSPNNFATTPTEAKPAPEALVKAVTLGAQPESKKEPAEPKENAAAKDPILAAVQDPKQDTFSFKKMSALNAKMSKMKMFSQDSEGHEAADDQAGAKPLREVKVNKKQV